MKLSIFRFVVVLLLIATAGSPGFAQGGASSSLSGTVVDQSGAVIPGADVTIKNEATGAEAKAITADNGTFMIPSLSAGTYTATVTVPNFKQSVTKNIVLVAATPSTVRIVLQVGGSSETVTVVAGAEVVQATSATVSTTLSTSQIAQLPLSTRNALDFLVFLPGVDTTGSARNATFMGMPNTTISISVDGINTQDQNYKGQVGGDGFYTMVTARPDAIQEVTVSTAASGSDSTGAGAVQIRFVTRSGNNDYNGGLYWYHRNPWLNSNYWFNNRDVAPSYWGDGAGRGQPCTAQQMATEFDNCKAKRPRFLLNQYGGRVGGPISIPKLFSGRDRAFFFLNLESFRMPNGETRNNTIYDPAVEQGNYIYLYKQSGQPDQVLSKNLLTLAQANGFTSTMDPTVQKLLSDIRNSTSKAGNILTYPTVANPLYQTYIWSSKGMETRDYMTTRFDFNITNKQKVEISWNGETRKRDPDYLNGRGWRYPGFPNYGLVDQHRGSTSLALRSTLTPRLVNEVRFGFNVGSTLFNPNVGSSAFAGQPDGIGDLGGYSWTPSGITGVSAVTTPSRRNGPIKQLDDTLTWTRGAHSMSFGGSFLQVNSWQWSQTLAASIGLGLPSAYDPAYAMFDSNNAKVNFPNSNATQQSAAATLYATLTARVTSISANAVINEDTNEYTYRGPFTQRARQREMGLFAQDSWRIRPGLTFTYGLRWEVSFPWTPLNNAYTWATADEVWGLSGPNSFFKPGATGGKPTLLYKFNAGDPAYNTDYKSFAPSIGFAWSPKAPDNFIGKILGGGSQTVVRGGFSIAYNRYGMFDFNDIYSANPGGTITANRSQDLGNLVNTAAGETWPLLFREKSRLAPPAFAKSPVFPLTPSIDEQVNAFAANIRTPYTMSWTFGVQREITKDMAVEVRYAATRNLQPWYYRNFNTERNLLENGWIDEFRKMQGNLYANIAAGKTPNFRYDPSVAGTKPLPVLLKWLGRGLDPNVAASYTTPVLTSAQAGVFTNTTYVNYLNTYSPAPNSLAGVLQGDSTRRGNAAFNGVPANFFIVNPAVQNGGAYIYQNGGGNYYDSMVVELRRRMAKGLLVQASYTWAKAFNLNVISFRAPWQKDLRNMLPHALKINWVWELPIGRGRALFNNSSTVVDRIIGGWQFQGATRIQSGNLLDLGNVVLVGMTDKEFADSVGVWFDDAKKIAYYLPKDFLDESYKAYQYDVGGFLPGTGAPTGRYAAPAGSAGAGNCIQLVAGDCAPRHHYFRGPMFMKFDLSLVKQIRFTERTNFELRGEFLNAFNNINFYGSSSFGALDSGRVTSAFTDASNSQDPGGRLIQLVLRINF
jgi:hypothetical protein